MKALSIGALALAAAALTLSAWLFSAHQSLRGQITQLDSRLHQIASERPYRQPLDKPLHSRAEIRQWAALKLVESFTFGPHNARRRLDQASDFYGDAAWKHLSEGIVNSGLLARVINQKWSVSAVPMETPLILAEGLNDGRYEWRVRVPMRLTLEGRNDEGKYVRAPDELTMEVRVRRSDNPAHEQGLEIASWKGLVLAENEAGAGAQDTNADRPGE